MAPLFSLSIPFVSFLVSFRIVVAQFLQRADRASGLPGDTDLAAQANYVQMGSVVTLGWKQFLKIVMSFLHVHARRPQAEAAGDPVNVCVYREGRLIQRELQHNGRRL